jgi:hypothetical protein
MVVVTADAAHLPQPAKIDLDRLMHTATLVTKFPPLPSRTSILAAINDQKRSGSGVLNPDVLRTDPTGIDARDVVASLRQQSTTRPRQNPGGR